MFRGEEMRKTNVNRDLTADAARPTAEQAIAATKRIVELKVEYDTIEQQMAQIRAEARQNWGIVNQMFCNLGA